MIEDTVECLICHKRFRSVGHHLRWAHGISRNEYCDRFGIRRGAALTGTATRDRMSGSIKATIAEGKLTAHYEGNAGRAGDAARASASSKRNMRAAGVDLPHGTERTPRSVIEGIVAAIEVGARVATAVKRSTIVYSAFHAGLSRHPDLKARVEAAKRQRT